MSIYEGSFCRCCAADGPSRDLITTYNWMGEEEVYADMLRECFDINMDTGEEDGICGVCITQLRNAFNFKKQVQHTEEQFKNKLLFKGKSLAKVKLEIEQNKTSDSETDALDMGADHDSDPEYEVPIKKEPAEAPLKPKAKRRASAAASKAKKVKTEGETSKSIRAVSVKIEPEIPCSEVVAKKRDKVRKKTKDPLKSINLEKTERLNEKRDKVSEEDEAELEKHVENLKNILRFSNATELDRSSRGLFKCPHCKVVLEKPEVLKSHVLTNHEEDKLKINSSLTMRNFYALLDVTGLSCKLCAKTCNKLEDLKDHLKTNHQVDFYRTQRNLTFEFEFTNGFTCTICSHSFLNFKTLSEHMNVHFRYFICEVCDHGYATASRLHMHKYRHKTGSFKCDECDEQFDVNWKKVAHIVKVHRAPVKSFRCSHCPERFAKVNELKQHTLDVHGIEIKPKIKCPACDKKFMSRQSLTRHKRKDHLLERNYTCSYCSKTFFQRGNLTEHLQTHTGKGVKNFQCQLCVKSYCRHQSLKKHMKSHTLVERFPCSICGQQFGQKSSWKRHMRNKHDEAVE